MFYAEKMLAALAFRASWELCKAALCDARETWLGQISACKPAASRLPPQRDGSMDHDVGYPSFRTVTVDRFQRV